jgi:hypothetical protein
VVYFRPIEFLNAKIKPGFVNYLRDATREEIKYHLKKGV